MPSLSIAEYKERAESCERLAETAASPFTRETMQYLALRWRILASEAEATIKDHHAIRSRGGFTSKPISTATRSTSA